MAIQEYAIIEYSDHKRLQSEVNEAIKHGWQPYGELKVIKQVTQDSLSEVLSWYVQVMVREE